MCRTLSFAFFNGASQFERSTNQETLGFLRAFFRALVILAAVSIADINMAAGTKVADSLLTAMTPCHRENRAQLPVKILGITEHTLI